MQNNFIYTIVLIIIGLFVISTIYHNYLETSSIEGFSTNTTRNRPSEAEMAEIEEREVMEIPNTMAELYHDPYEIDPTVPEIKMDQGSHAVPDKEEFDKVLHLNNTEEEGFKNEENVGIFTKFYNFLIGKKPVKEGFGFGGYPYGFQDITTHHTGPDGSVYAVTVRRPNPPHQQPAQPAHNRRGRRNRRHRRRRRNAGRWFWHHSAEMHNWRNAMNTWGHWYNMYHGHHGHKSWWTYENEQRNAKVRAKNKEIEAEMERKRRAAIVKKLTDKHTKTGDHIRTVKSALDDYKMVKQDENTKQKVITESGTRIYAGIGSRLVDEGKNNPKWETDLTGYHKVKVPTYTDQFEWTSGTKDATGYIARQKADRLRENKIAENIGTRNANWPTIEKDMNNLLKPYYEDNKVPETVKTDILAAYGMNSDPYTWTLTKHKNAATDKMYEIKKAKDAERTEQLIRLKNESVARRKAADAARQTALVEMAAVKQHAITMNEARKVEMEKLAKAMAKRAEVNNELVKDMTNTMDKRLLSNVSSQKDMLNWTSGPFPLQANATTLTIRDAANALETELRKTRATKDYLKDARMDNIREISLRARQNYDKKLYENAGV